MVSYIEKFNLRSVLLTDRVTDYFIKLGTNHLQNNLSNCQYFNQRIIRSREFGLEKRWLLMVDLEQREKRQENKQKLNKKVNLNL